MHIVYLACKEIADMTQTKVIGWTKNGVPCEAPNGIHAEDFFRDGKYLGPDSDGVEPVFSDNSAKR